MFTMICVVGGTWLLMDAVGGTHLETIDEKLREIRDRDNG